MKILIVEDDPQITEVVAMAFEVRWPDAETIKVHKGKDAISSVENDNPDLVILDLGLPDMDGFDVLKDIRLFSAVPVIILTARDQESDIVKGLEKGADDYLVKPFRQLELMSRAQAVLRRYHLVSSYSPLSAGSLKFGQSMHTLFLGDKRINLTSTEGIILSHLMRNPKKVVALSSLSEAVWGTDYPGSYEAVRVYIRRLRKKLEVNPENPEIIITHPGSGYSLQPPGIS